VRPETLLSIVVFTGTLLAGPVCADQPAPPPAQPAAEVKSDRHDLICRHLPNTGSLLPGPKVCHERWEWEEIQIQSQRELEHAQRLPGAHPG
jgi:hypothetical protein